MSETATAPQKAPPQTSESHVPGDFVFALDDLIHDYFPNPVKGMEGILNAYAVLFKHYADGATPEDQQTSFELGLLASANILRIFSTSKIVHETSDGPKAV